MCGVPRDLLCNGQQKGVGQPVHATGTAWLAVSTGKVAPVPLSTAALLLWDIIPRQQYFVALVGRCGVAMANMYIESEQQPLHATVRIQTFNNTRAPIMHCSDQMSQFPVTLMTQVAACSHSQPLNSNRVMAYSLYVHVLPLPTDCKAVGCDDHITRFLTPACRSARARSKQTVARAHGHRSTTPTLCDKPCGVGHP